MRALQQMGEKKRKLPKGFPTSGIPIEFPKDSYASLKIVLLFSPIDCRDKEFVGGPRDPYGFQKGIDRLRAEGSAC